MINLQEYIRSGVLEAYVNGRLNTDQRREVENVMQQHSSIKQRVDELCDNLEEKVRNMAIQPPKGLRAVVLASVNYLDRRSKGEPAAFPPPLQQGSTAADYQEWLDRQDFNPPETVSDMHIRIIGKTPTITTAVVWMQEMQTETHRHEIETFLIVEGTCTVYLGPTEHPLKPGDLMTIPTDQEHWAVATSLMPCKIILQRINV